MALAYCSLFSGSSGNSSIIASDDTKIMIDAGLSGKSIQSEIAKIGIEAGSIKAIIVTHEHIDHVKGVGVLSRKFDLPIYANELTWNAMHKKVGPIAQKNVRVFETGREFCIGDIEVYPFLIPHDAAEPVGYTFNYNKSKVTQLTDLGHFPKRLINIVENSDLIMLESNHDETMLKNGRYPYMLQKRILGTRGHLSNDMCANSCIDLMKRNCKRFVLGHLSEENNNEQLAYETTLNSIKNSGAIEKQDFELYMASRYKCSRVFVLE